MGTNYYARIDTCDKCGRAAECVHLGKMSAGWAFLFRMQPEKYANFEEFWEFILRKNVVVVDEYEQKQDKEELIDKIKQSYLGTQKRHDEKIDPQTGFETNNITTGGYDFCTADFS